MTPLDALGSVRMARVRLAAAVPTEWQSPAAHAYSEKLRSLLEQLFTIEHCLMALI